MTLTQTLPSINFRRALELMAWLAIMLWVLSAPNPAAQLPKIGRNSIAPSLAHLTTLDGQPLTFDPTKKIFLTFFGVHCYWSEIELPMLAEFARTRDDVQVIAVAFGGGKDVEAGVVRAYLKGHDMPYTIALDPEGLTAYQFGISATPSSFVIDPNGVINYARHGGGPGITAYQLGRWADFIPQSDERGEP